MIVMDATIFVNLGQCEDRITVEYQAENVVLLVCGTDFSRTQLQMTLLSPTDRHSAWGALADAAGTCAQVWEASEHECWYQARRYQSLGDHAVPDDLVDQLAWEVRKRYGDTLADLAISAGTQIRAMPAHTISPPWLNIVSPGGAYGRISVIMIAAGATSWRALEAAAAAASQLELERATPAPTSS